LAPIRPEYMVMWRSTFLTFNIWIWAARVFVFGHLALCNSVPAASFVRCAWTIMNANHR
jgi:hypothetical protein